MGVDELYKFIFRNVVGCYIKVYLENTGVSTCVWKCLGIRIMLCSEDVECCSVLEGSVYSGIGNACVYVC